MSKPVIRVGTRGSQLATTQTGMVVEALKTANPEFAFETVIVKTVGDADQKTPLTAFKSTGIFIKELEEALYRNEIDLAVHSLKDVPHELPTEMKLVAFFDREDPRDAFISKFASIQDLPERATVGSGSPRRLIQLKALRPDLRFTQLRGNIDTRLSKAESGELDAVILACAGLDRMGWEQRITARISTDDMLPAIGQGIVTLEARAGDEIAAKVAAKINRDASEKAAMIERQFMEKMGGGCKVPLAALAEMTSEGIDFKTLLGDLRTGQTVRLAKLFDLENWSEELDSFILDFKKVCKSLELPLPNELPEHYLLEETRLFFENS